MYTSSPLKKYVLYLVGLLFVLIGSHLVYLYIYSDADTDPIAGGIARVGLLSPSGAPSIDPVEYDSRTGGSDLNDMLTYFLYRGLLSYDANQEKIVEDLSICEIQDFPKFTCTLNEDALWDNGDLVSVDDVVATYNFYKNFSKNIGLKSRLEKIQVEAIDNTVQLTFATSDITILDVLFIPILRAEDIARFEDQGSFQQYSFSGPYTFRDRSQDVATGVDTITLQRNPSYTHKDVFINQINFSFYTTQEELESVSKNLDIVFTGEGILSDGNESDFSYFSYLRPQYYSAFLSYDGLTQEQRTFLSTDVLSRDTAVSEFDLLPVRNVFMQPVQEPEVTEAIDIESIMRNEGYISGTEYNEVLLQEYQRSITSVQDDLEPIETEIQDIEIDALLVRDTSFVTSPSDTSVFITQSDEHEIVGVFPLGTTKVTVNNYELRLFNASEGVFKYRTSNTYQNIVEGKNTYNIAFFSADGTQLDSEVYEIWYTTNSDTLVQYQNEVTPVVPEIDPVPEAETLSEEEIAAPPVLDKVDASYFYTQEGERFSYSVVYPSSSEVLSAYAEEIQENAEKFGVYLDLIPASKEEIEDIASGQERDYDIFLTGVYTGVFDYNIFPSFHSGQARSGLNFSGIRDTQLDGLLESSRDGVYYSSPTQLIQLKQDILEILDPLAVVYTIGSPYEHLYVRSEKLQGIDVPEKLPSIELLSDVMLGSYLQVSYSASAKDKSIQGFIRWFFSSLIRPSGSRI